MIPISTYPVTLNPLACFHLHSKAVQNIKLNLSAINKSRESSPVFIRHISRMLKANATTSTAHSKTKDLDGLLAIADIVVAAVGIPNFIDCKKLKKGSVLIDAGYHPDEKCGDVDMNGITEIVSAYTPVPGGVGPMTIAMLLKNTLKACEFSD